MGRTPLTTIALAILLTACAERTALDLSVTTQELASPAGPASGEPFLSVAGDRVHMSWLQAAPEGGHDLLTSRLEEDTWTAPLRIAHSERFFVNWADFPSVTAGPDGTLWAHWLERGEAGGYDYGVRIVRSSDGGEHWSEPWTPHEDVSPTEHGFVSALALEDGMGFVWLDGRRHAGPPDGTPPAMTLRYRSVTTEGAPGMETLLDERVCDCCQTDAAMAASGPVVVYRDRSEGEIRDIYVTRFVDGVWTEGAPVHEDGWRIDACPVNGPAVAARGDDVAVAWFTGAGDVPHVRVAFSEDGGATFSAPVEVDDGGPLGRVDVILTGPGTALVSWLEGRGGEAAQVRLRRVGADGRSSTSVTLTESTGARASGFPRMVQHEDGSLVVAWTDVVGEEPRVRVQRVDLTGAMP